MFRNAVTRRIARETAPTTFVVIDDQEMAIRRRPARQVARRAAIVASRYGFVS